jgi:zinc finger-like protein
MCMLCGTRQPVAGSCSSCGGSMAGYYCGICHLFDDEPGRDIYHCPFCNVCRYVSCAAVKSNASTGIAS